MHNSIAVILMVDNVCDMTLLHQNIKSFKLVIVIEDFETKVPEGNTISGGTILLFKIPVIPNQHADNDRCSHWEFAQDNLDARVLPPKIH